jgi:hypothetical protein
MRDETILLIAHRTAWKYKYSTDPHHSDTYTFNDSCMLDFARKLLEAGKAENETEIDIPYPEGCKLCNVASGCDGSCY